MLASAWDGTVVDVLVKEDGFEVASDSEVAAPLVFQSLQAMLTRTLLAPTYNDGAAAVPDAAGSLTQISLL